jgi:hypothetical protein
MIFSISFSLIFFSFEVTKNNLMSDCLKIKNKKQNHNWAGESGCQQIKIKKSKDWQIVLKCHNLKIKKK